MTLQADLYWSFRSPYSYLGTKHYRSIAEQFDVDIRVRPVYPLAIRKPEFFKSVNPLWLPYLVIDCKRIAEFRGLPFFLPSPDPVVQNRQTREIAAEQPYIYWLTRLGLAAVRRGQGMAFIDEVSFLIWGSGTVDWNKGDHMHNAAQRAGLDLRMLEEDVTGHEEDIDAELQANQEALQKAGHWGVPTLVFDNEPFHGQDRIDLALWRMKQKGLKPRA